MAVKSANDEVVALDIKWLSAFDCVVWLLRIRDIFFNFIWFFFKHDFKLMDLKIGPDDLTDRIGNQPLV